MARIRSMLGTIEGSAGGLTFASRGGINVLRQKVGKNSSNSPAQQAQRTKFGAIGKLARAIGTLLQAGYKTVGGQTGYNRFVGFNSSAVSLDSANMPQIDYGMIEISSGSVTMLAGLTLANAATGKTVNWANNSDGNNALASDKVFIAIVKKATGEVAASYGAASRAAGSVLVAAPYLVGIAAGELAVYAFAKRAIGSDASNTSRLASGVSSTGGGVSYTRTATGPSQTVASTTITSGGADKFEFNELTTGTSGPYNMVISVGGQQVASIDLFDRYAGQAFRFTEANGAVHTGVVANTVNF